MRRRRGSWGGARAGAGRPPGPKPKVRHLERPELEGQQTLHLVLQLLPELGSLRQAGRSAVVRRALALSAERPGLRLTHAALQRSSIELIARAESKRALRSGMSSLCIRLARALNRTLGRSGRVFRDRYQARVLSSTRALRAARARVQTPL